MVMNVDILTFYLKVLACILWIGGNCYILVQLFQNLSISSTQLDMLERYRDLLRSLQDEVQSHLNIENKNCNGFKDEQMSTLAVVRDQIIDRIREHDVTLHYVRKSIRKKAGTVVLFVTILVLGLVLILTI